MTLIHTIRCAWCLCLIRAGSLLLPVSHSICASCAAKHFDEVSA